MFVEDGADENSEPDHIATLPVACRQIWQVNSLELLIFIVREAIIRLVYQYEAIFYFELGAAKISVVSELHCGGKLKASGLSYG